MQASTTQPLELCGLVGVNDTETDEWIDAVVAGVGVRSGVIVMVGDGVMRVERCIEAWVEMDVPVALAGLLGSCFL